MATVRFTRLQLEEIIHKLHIVSDEPDIQSDYEVTQDDVDALASAFDNALRHGEDKVEFEDRFIGLIAGEVEDRMASAEANWLDAGDQDEGAVYRSLHSLVKKLKSINPQQQDHARGDDESPSP